MKIQSLSYSKGLILAFVIGFVIRLIPEILSFPYPIGWDTIFYAYRISDGVLFGYWNTPFSTWLLYGILIFLGNLTQLSPFILLKIVAPLLFGGSAAGIYFVAWKKLDWGVNKCLLASSFFVFQLGALAISWHFYRNVFGVMILLFILPLLKSNLSWKETGLLSVLSLSVVLGHEFAAVSLFFVVFSLLLVSVLKREQVSYRLLVAVLPALGLFLVNVLGLGGEPVGLDRVFLTVNDSVRANPAGLYFLTDYLNVFTPFESYSNYFDLLVSVFSLFVVLYLVLLPLISTGYFKDRVLSSWLLLLLIGAFGCLILPFSALLLWNRWMLLLVYPFTFFAVHGLWKLLKNSEGVSISRFFSSIKLTKKIGIGLTLLSVVFGGLFMCWPLVDGKYGVIGFGDTFVYVPSTMQSSSVPLQDTQAVMDAFEWLNTNMDGTSSLLAHDVFEFWTLLYLNKENDAIVFDHDLDAAKTLAIDNGYKDVYFVWWNTDIGWYNLGDFDGCFSVFDSGRISVFKFA